MTDLLHRPDPGSSAEPAPEGRSAGSRPPGSRQARRRAARLRRRRRRLKLVALGCAVLLVVVAGAGWAVLRALTGNITTDDAFDRLGGDRSAAGAGEPLDILLMGSDTREGVNAELGGQDEGARSDTTLLLHISADRSSATAVSIPRDTMVDIPACPLPDGGTSEPTFGQFNSAYTTGGPACTIATVEAISGITLDHFAVIDFAGFVGMVDALGGVDVCLAEPLRDRSADLDLPAGEQTVDGTQALGLVRARKALGNGGDLGRIDRQQQFLSALVRKVQSAGILLNPVRLVQFLDAATQSLTTDPGLADVRTLASLAESVRDVGNDRIAFVTTPTTTYAEDPNRLVFDEAGTAAIWAALAADEPLPGTPAAAAAGAPARATPQPATTPVRTPPERISVRVLDGTGVPGRAAEVADALRAQGYTVVETGDAESGTAATTVVRHSADYDESGRTVATAAGARTEVDPDAGSVVTLVVGPGFAGIVPVTVEAGTASAAAPPAPALTPTTVEQNACVG